MKVLAVCAFGILAVCVASVVRQFKGDFAPFLSAAAGIVLTLYAVAALSPVLSYLRTLAAESGMSGYFTLLAKVLGVSLVTSITAELCRDCGENGIASRIEFAGKVAILLLALPAAQEIITLARGLL